MASASLDIIDSHAMYIANKTGPLHVEVIGPESGPAVLFFHGATASLNFFLPSIYAAKLHETHRCVLFDLEGLGRSPLSPETTSLSIEGFANDGKAILDKLDIKTASLVGWSMGGMVATTFAGLYPDITESLVLIGSGMAFPPSVKPVLQARADLILSDGIDAILNDILESSLSAHTNATNPLAKAFLRLSVTSTPPRGLALVCLAIASASDPSYETIRQRKKGKTTLIAGKEDLMVPGEMTKALQKVLGADTVWLEKVGHWHGIEDVEGTAKGLKKGLGAQSVSGGLR